MVSSALLNYVRLPCSLPSLLWFMLTLELPRGIINYCLVNKSLVISGGRKHYSTLKKKKWVFKKGSWLHEWPLQHFSGNPSYSHNKWLEVITESWQVKLSSTLNIPGKKTFCVVLLLSRSIFTDLENKLMVTKGNKLEEGMDGSFGTGICTLRYIEWPANGDLLYSTGEST